MRLLMYIIIGFFGWGSLCSAELETRLHAFEYASPDLVEKQLRQIVPEPSRVSVNAAAKQVIVVADEETHQKIASMLRELGRPARQLQFKVRHNRETLQFAVRDAVPITLPVSQTPSAQVAQMARERLAPEQRDYPLVGAVLQAHVILLREDPAVARVRVTPTVLFGLLPPYEVVDFTDLSMDFLVTTEGYIELQEKLSSHSFYEVFLQTQPDPQVAPRPVSLLISFEGFVSDLQAPVNTDEDD